MYYKCTDYYNLWIESLNSFYVVPTIIVSSLQKYNYIDNFYVI